MKAREIKQLMVGQYKSLVRSYEYDIEALAGKRARIRLIEQDLKHYFNIEECYKFDKEEDVPF